MENGGFRWEDLIVLGLDEDISMLTVASKFLESKGLKC